MAPLQGDPAARAVLAYLAVKSDSNGRNAYPLALSIAHDVGLSPQVVPRVLKRLVGYDLIVRDGAGPQGQPRWALRMDHCHPEGSFEAFCERHREGESTRKAKYRQSKMSPTFDSGQSRIDSTGHGEDVPYSESSCPVSRVVMSRTRSTDVPYSEYPQINPHQPLDQSTSTLSAPSAPAADAAEFELTLVDPPAKPKAIDPFPEFWAAYPRKVGRKAAEKAFAKATKDVEPETIIVGAERYAKARSGQDPKYTAHAATWLNAGRWDDEDEPLPQAVGGYQPYRDPSDQSVYDQPL